MKEEKSCSWGDCYPEDTGCQCGETDFTKCKHYKQEKVVADLPKDDMKNFVQFPWTGSVLGLHDLNYISSHSSVTIIGVVGTAKTGKTTFLALLYCLLRNGRKIGDFSFVGSYTFTGWEDIAWNLSWKSSDPKIQFPPHTTSNAGRTPGLLHLALKGSDGIVHDIIFTDAPGEWFQDWSINKSDPKAEGANWVYEKSNSFLVFADCDKLSGEERGTARNDIRQLLLRLKENIDGRFVGLVWSKSDIEVATPIKEGISRYFASNFGNNSNEFEVSAYQNKDEWQNNVLNSMNYLLISAYATTNTPLDIPVFEQDDLLLSRRK